MNIEQIINTIHILPEASRLKLQESIETITLPRGYLLFNAGKVEKSVYFIKKGIARAYAYLGDSEVTFWFGQEGDTIISMKSYVENKPGYESIELLEKSELYHLKTKDLQMLFDNDINIANWGRKFAEAELIKMEERFISRQFKSASERYMEILKDKPSLIQRVQLGYIASYLGITQGSLSRIRAQK